MIDKEWLGADLIFDLDADHLPEMEEVKKGKITFSKLMVYIREQTYRLVVDVLFGDFGLSEKDLLITFSGGRGYHVHVRTSDMLTLPSGARREIADTFIPISNRYLLSFNLSQFSSIIVLPPERPIT